MPINNKDFEVKVSADIVELLNEEAFRMNSPQFIADDPVQFPHLFHNQKDIEIVSLLAATIAWGNRKMIIRDMEKMLSLMEYEPYLFTINAGYHDIDDKLNIHRTFFGRHLKMYLQGLHAIYDRYDNLEAFGMAVGVPQSDAPAWHLVGEMQKIFTDANGGKLCERCLPADLKHTALKRINMALRWLVRDDGIVDLGVWKSIPKSKLFIPLDVHVGNTARSLGLLDRRQNDRRAVEELTATLRELRPDDPAWYDYALFGIGVMGRMDNLGINIIRH